MGADRVPSNPARPPVLGVLVKKLLLLLVVAGIVAAVIGATKKMNAEA